MGIVKRGGGRRGRTKISDKNQATIPVEALRKAGLRPGDELVVEAASRGRIVLARADDLIARHAGNLSGLYPKGYLERLRQVEDVLTTCRQARAQAHQACSEAQRGVGAKNEAEIVLIEESPKESNEERGQQRLVVTRRLLY